MVRDLHWPGGPRFEETGSLSRRSLSVPREVRAGGSSEGLSSPPFHSPSSSITYISHILPSSPLSRGRKVCGSVHQASVLPQASRWVNPGLSKTQGNPQTLLVSNTEPPSCPCTQQSSGDPRNHQPGGPPSTISGFAWSCEPSQPRTPSGCLWAVFPMAMGREEGSCEGRFPKLLQRPPTKDPKGEGQPPPRTSPGRQSSVSDQRSRPVRSSQLPGSVSSGPNAKSFTACLHPVQLSRLALARWTRPSSHPNSRPSHSCLVCLQREFQVWLLLGSSPSQQVYHQHETQAPCTSPVSWLPCLLTTSPFLAWFSQLWPCCPLVVPELFRILPPQGLCTSCPSVRTSFPGMHSPFFFPSGLCSNVTSKESPSLI